MGTVMEKERKKMGCSCASQGKRPENRAENLLVAERDEDERRENMQEQTRRQKRTRGKGRVRGSTDGHGQMFLMKLGREQHGSAGVYLHCCTTAAQ